MPLIEAQVAGVFSGPDRARLEKLLMTVVAREFPDCADRTIVRVETSRPENIAAGDAVGVVRDFLTLLERRDLERAQRLVSEDFVMQFPGADPMYTLDDFVGWATHRYQFVRKSDLAFDLSEQGETSVVYVRGTLAGRWLDATPFEGIRFLDRFEIRGGFIVRQDVWNDIAAARANQ